MLSRCAHACALVLCVALAVVAQAPAVALSADSTPPVAMQPCTVVAAVRSGTLADSVHCRYRMGGERVFTQTAAREAGTDTTVTFTIFFLFFRD